MSKVKLVSVAVLCFAATCSCEFVDLRQFPDPEDAEDVVLSLEDVARVLSKLPLGDEQLQEVHDAVSSSSSNGYDEEYMLTDLLEAPGSGVGEAVTRAPLADGGHSYTRPIRDLLKEYLDLNMSTATKAVGGMTCEKYLEALSSSGLQIYWPESGNWDGAEMPTITWDPADGSLVNTGFRLGEGGMEEVEVDEKYAAQHPVWVINSNDDSAFRTLQTIRRDNPEWMGEGGLLTIGSPASENADGQAVAKAGGAAVTRAGGDGSAPLRSLVLKSLTMKEHGDTWFCGASEYFVKIGAMESFRASTEAELKLYNPQITDFMVVARRKMLGEPIECNVLLVSDWTDQLESCAFMIVEDDGGTRSSWTCEGKVMVQSKSYGFSVNLPINARDDIIWRGSLSSRYFEAKRDEPVSFGTVELVFEFEEK
ncbi:MAG: hypothetical protein HUJ94_05280 [Bacteroidales bacterium]|nr:hypothetical protein [Bacteroidales bacterium]